MKRKVNITIELDYEETEDFKGWLSQYVNVTDYVVFPDAKDLYNSDPVYKKMCKKRKEDKISMYNYIKAHT